MTDKLRVWYARYTAQPSDKHIGVLDGVRALAVFIVAWYHIWQQSWLRPSLFIGDTLIINLDGIIRAGYYFVDVMILLSGFLLFLPYARSIISEGRNPKLSTYYIKRAARILPSYWLSIVVFLIIALAQGLYSSPSSLALDLGAHLTFTQTLFRQSYVYTNLNGVLWTVGVEAQMYLLFPLFAAAFRKKPLVTYFSMVGVAFLFRYLVGAYVADTTTYINQLPAFLDVYANGMALALIYASMCRRIKADKPVRIFFTVVAAMAMLLLVGLINYQARMGSMEAIRLGMMRGRFTLSVYAGALMVSLAFSAGFIRFLFSNKLMVFFSAVSYNVYIWHQSLSVWLKKSGLIPSAFAEPNVEGDLAWQVPFTWLSFALALLAGIIVTYALEKPVCRAVSRRLERMKTE
ncbi:MAG: acyltransferase [Eubacteriales bacterium]|nr:acyltransferase [Eubacteriales bacterium]MDD3883162.1 acyltransferase [Eubacteriales bacterium]MDD4512455.1 acyltransferase [Eubacteriales bacterium]